MVAWSKGETVEIRSPDATRPWQHVLEPLSGYLNLGSALYQDQKLHGEAINFVPRAEQNHTVVDLLVDLSKYWDFKDSSNSYKVTGNIPFHEAGLLKLNCDKALFHLKWVPTLDYKRLTDFTSRWYYNFYNSNSNMFEFTLDQIKEYQKMAKFKEIEWTKMKN